MAEANNPAGVPKSELIARELENAQKAATGQPDPATSGAHAQPDRKYAGKFNSAEDMEKSYKELESRLGRPSSRVGDLLLQKVMRENPSLSEAEAAAFVEQNLSGEPETEAEKPDNRVARNPHVDKAVSFVQNQEFTQSYPEASKAVPMLKELQTTPRFKYKTLTEIYEDPSNGYLREMFQQDTVPVSMTASGGAPSEISTGRIPSMEEMRDMARREGIPTTDIMKRYIPTVNTPF